jgi:hypothetical protein
MTFYTVLCFQLCGNSLGKALSCFSMTVPPCTHALVGEWKQVLAEMFQHLVESLPKRMEAVIAAKGGPTPYLLPMILE